jgi:hypothetical protein
MKIPPDLDDPNAPQGTPPSTPELDPNLSLTKKSSKTPMIVVAVLLVGGVGFVMFRSMQQRKQKEVHANVMKQFADIEKDEVIGKFWACLFGPNVDPGQFPNNLALAQRVEMAFTTDPKNFPTKVREECTPKAIDARHKVESISAPSEYDAPFKKYEASLTELSTSFDEWAKLAPSHMEERLMGQKVATDGAAWHAFAGGKPGADVIAYDRFFHCAIPTLDKMKDGQAVVEYLYKQCKDPKYLDHLSNDCSKEVTTEGVPQAATPGFNKTVGKLAGDDRELSAFNSCLHKSRASKRTDDSEGIGKAWVAYMEAGRAVREVGKAALAE